MSVCMYVRHDKAEFPYSKDLVVFPVSRHFSGRSVPPCAGRFSLTKDFVIFLFPDTFQVISPVYRHFLDSKVSRNRKTTKFL